MHPDNVNKLKSLEQKSLKLENSIKACLDRLKNGLTGCPGHTARCTVEQSSMLTQELSILRLENSLLKKEIELSRKGGEFMALLDSEVDDRTWARNAWDQTGPCDRDVIMDNVNAVDFALPVPYFLRNVLMPVLVKNARCSFSGRFLSLRPATNLFKPHGPISESQDDEALLRDLFCEIDKNDDGVISFEELEIALIKYGSQEISRILLKNWRCAVSGRFFPVRPCSNQVQSSTGINYGSFLKAFEELPRVRGERVRWARSLKLESFLAGLLIKGNIFDGLKGLREINAADMDRHVLEVSARFSQLLPPLLKSALMKLKAYEDNAIIFKNEKFALEGASVGSFAELDDFYEGTEKLIGAPNQNIDEGVKREHCERSNCSTIFVAPNYNFTTCSKDEYYFVVSPSASVKYPHTPADKLKWNPVCSSHWKGDHGRDVKSLEHFMESKITKTGIKAKAILRTEELICLRLYTGPCFILYNAVLRKKPQIIFDSLCGNNYETTIFSIISGITKLSKFTSIPPDRKLYRGLGGTLLPEKFWNTSGSFRGGVEWGFMSTTTSRKISMQYSGMDKKRGTVFEIVAGRIDIGAELAWVSQYPSEAEYLFPPLSCLEVFDEPYVEAGVIIFPLRVNMNIKGLTYEQLVERRKLLHMSMVKNLREELRICIDEELSKRVTKLQEMDRNALHLHAKFSIKKIILEQFDLIMHGHECQDPSFYNVDKNYELATSEAIGMKSSVINKLAVYFRYLCGGNDQTIEEISALTLEYFSQEYGLVDMIIQSGVSDFPWKDIVNNGSVITFNHLWKFPTEKFQRLSNALISNVDNAFELHRINFSNVQSISFSPHLLSKDTVQLGALRELRDPDHYDVLCLFLSLMGKIGPRSGTKVNITLKYGVIVYSCCCFFNGLPF